MSSISLDQVSINHLVNQYLLPKDKIFDNLFLSFEDDSLRVDINNVKCPFLIELILGSNISILITFKIIMNKLYIRTNLLGIAPTIIQNIPGITSLVLLFCPSLEKIKGLSFESTFDLVYDLHSIDSLKIFNFESLTTTNNQLTLNLSAKE